MATAFALHPDTARHLQRALAPQRAAVTRELSGQATVTGPAEMSMLVIVGAAAIVGVMFARQKTR